MAKVRVVMVDLEGADETVKGAVMGLLGRIGPPVEMVHGVSLAGLAATAEPLRLPAVPAKRRGGPAKACPTTVPAEIGSRAQALRGAEELRGAIPMLLKKRGALTSKEIIDATKATPSTVYQQLARLREAGVIETREDAADGERKNFLARPA